MAAFLAAFPSARPAAAYVPGSAPALRHAGELIQQASLRHDFAVTYIRNGEDIHRLSRVLGHTQISTTQQYLWSIRVEHLLENYLALRRWPDCELRY